MAGEARDLTENRAESFFGHRRGMVEPESRPPPAPPAPLVAQFTARRCVARTSANGIVTPRGVGGEEQMGPAWRCDGGGWDGHEKLLGWLNNRLHSLLPPSISWQDAIIGSKPAFDNFSPSMSEWFRSSFLRGTPSAQLTLEAKMSSRPSPATVLADARAAEQGPSPLVCRRNSRTARHDAVRAQRPRVTLPGPAKK